MKKIFLILITLVPFLGKAQVTLIPDNDFEKALIYWEIDSDGIVNGQILTVDAHSTTNLNLVNVPLLFPIRDLTGIEDFINLEEFIAIETQIPDGIDLSMLTKLKTLYFTSNNQTTMDFSTLVDLEYLTIGNAALDVGLFNLMKVLDLSNNTELKYVDAYNLVSLELINMRNNAADSVTFVLGNENNVPYNVCIEVDDHIGATNGTPPYDNWEVYGNHYFSDKCTLSTENFIQNNFKIYPNPAQEYVSVEYDENIGVQLRGIQILDSSGKWVRSVKDNFHQINVYDLSSGVYLFVIQTDKGNKTEKVVVK